MLSLKGMRFSIDVILVGIRWYGAYPLSYRLSIILTYNHSPPGRSGEALGLPLTANKFTQILVPVMCGSLGSALGILPIFWASGALLLWGGFNNSQHGTQLGQPDQS